jgi:dienelactone hydrolase
MNLSEETMRIAAVLLAGYCCCSIANAEIVTTLIDYKHSDTQLRGYLAYDGAVEGKRPGVLVVHEWWGLNDYAKQRARQLAEQGYVAFALDMYGKDVIAKDRAEAARMSGEFKGKPIIRERAKAGYDVLAKQELVDENRIAAIGYCFGGTTVLELAYSGADLVGVVSFHGGLVAPKPGDKIKAKFLALHGADDPFVPAQLVTEFQQGMRESGADWQLVAYGDAVHTFTNPKAGSDKSTGSAYNEKADRWSWKNMQAFFDEVFKRK